MALACLFAAAAAAQVAPGALDVTITAGDASRYTLSLDGRTWWRSQSPPSLRGQPLGPALTANAPLRGADRLGTFALTQTIYRAGPHARVELGVKVYDGLPLAVFSTRLPDGEPAVGGGAGEPAAESWSDPRLAPIIGFPSIPRRGAASEHAVSSARWLVWNQGQLGTTTGLQDVSSILQPSTAARFASDNFVASPIVLFDRASNGTLIIAPMDHFHGSLCRQQPGQPAWGCGVSNLVPAGTLPANFSSAFGVFGGTGGVTDTLHEWGQAMQRLLNTRRVRDLALTRLSFFTDNGYLLNAGGAVNGWATQATLVDTLAKLASSGVPIGLLQLDDWWYNSPLTDSSHMVVADAVGNETLFPHGLTGLYEALRRVQPGVALDIYANHFTATFGLLAAHPEIRTIDSLLYGYEGRLPAPADSKRFYSLLYEGWKEAGIRSSEIDFMKDFVYNQSAFLRDPEGARGWLEGMAEAAEATEVTLQWCTVLGMDLLQALRFPAVTNVRASNDCKMVMLSRIARCPSR